MRQIIAMGGGGFSMEPENLALDQYILSQTSQTRPRVCFMATASGDSPGYIERFERAFGTLPCIPDHLSLFRPQTADVEDFLCSHDVIYVGGGNTFNMLALWRAWGIDQILHKAWINGTVLAGISAGSICWFEQGITDSFFGELRAIAGLGFLSGSHCPHYDGEHLRRPRYQELLSQNGIMPGWAADNGVALHFIDDDLHSIVSSRNDASAYKVECVDGVVREVALPPTVLTPVLPSDSGHKDR